MLVTYLTSGGNAQSWFKSYTEQAIKILLSKGVKISSSGSEGGYLSVFEPNSNAYTSPKMEYLIACGNFPAEKSGRYMYLSIEKAVRLNLYIEDGHRLSRKSAEIEKEEYPGSIFMKLLNRIFSFSGLDPQWDEFLSLLNAVFCCYLNRRQYTECEKLEDIPALFEKWLPMITAITDEEAEIMISTVRKLVANEIALRDEEN